MAAIRSMFRASTASTMPATRSACQYASGAIRWCDPHTARLVVDVVQLHDLAALLDELTERRSCRSALRHSTIVFSHRPANGASPDLSGMPIEGRHHAAESAARTPHIADERKHVYSYARRTLLTCRRT